MKKNHDSDTDILDIDVPQNIKADLRKFNKAEQQVNLTVAALAEVKVETAEDLPAAMDTLKKAKIVENLIEDKRKELVKPFNDEVKKINTYAKDLTAKLPPAINDAKAIVIAFNQAEEKRVKDELISNRKKQLVELGVITEEGSTFTCVHPEINVIDYQIENYDPTNWGILIGTIHHQLKQINEAKLQQLQLDKDDADLLGLDDDIEDINSQIENIQQPVEVSSYAPPIAAQVSGITKRWVFKVADTKLVPREYLMVDEGKIRKAVAEGIRDIPGVTIYQEDGLSIRN